MHRVRSYVDEVSNDLAELSDAGEGTLSGGEDSLDGLLSKVLYFHDGIVKDDGNVTDNILHGLSGQALNIEGIFVTTLE